VKAWLVEAVLAAGFGAAVVRAAAGLATAAFFAFFAFFAFLTGFFLALAAPGCFLWITVLQFEM